MVTVTPRYTLTSWTHRWMWPLIALDAPDQAAICKGDTGTQFHAIPRWFGGWDSMTSIIGTNEVPGGGSRTALDLAGNITPKNDPPETCISVLTDMGHWTNNLNGVIRLDGQILDSNPQYCGIAIHWPWMLCKVLDGQGPFGGFIRIWKSGRQQRDVTLQVSPLVDSITVDGVYVYGDGQRAFLNYPDNSTVEVNQSCIPGGMAPIAAKDGNGLWWLWSAAGPNNEFLIVREMNTTAKSGWKLALPFGCAGLDVTWGDGLWWIAWHTDVGHCGVASVYLSLSDAEPLPIILDPSLRDPKGTIACTPTSGPSPLAVTTTVTLAPDSGATAAVRHYGQLGAADPVRWSGPSGNDLTASGTLTGAGAWHVWARMQGTNGHVVDTPYVEVTASPSTPEPPIPPQPPIPMNALLGINAFAGAWPPDARLQTMVERGVRSVRTWIGATAHDAQQNLAQFAKFPSLKPLWLIHLHSLASMEQQIGWLPNGSTIEIGNEPNLGDAAQGIAKMTPGQYAAFANAAHTLAVLRSHTAFYGSVSNCNPSGVKWMREVIRLCPWINDVSLHRYSYEPNQNADASAWGSRYDELREIRSVLATGRGTPRNARITEIGAECGPAIWHTHEGFLGLKTVWHPITEQGQYDRLSRDLWWWKQAPFPVTGIDIYQECCGTTEFYGLNAPDGTPRLAWTLYR